MSECSIQSSCRSKTSTRLSMTVQLSRQVQGIRIHHGWVQVTWGLRYKVGDPTWWESRSQRGRHPTHIPTPFPLKIHIPPALLLHEPSRVLCRGGRIWDTGWSRGGPTPGGSRSDVRTGDRSYYGQCESVEKVGPRPAQLNKDSGD